MAVLRHFYKAQRAVMRLDGIESRFVSSAVGRVHLFDVRGRGSLPTVVFLHGFGDAASSFYLLARYLRPHVRRVLIPDAPGHGFSDEPGLSVSVDALLAAFEDVLSRELDEPAVIFGNSLGGATAMRFALSKPALARALVLSSPAGAWMEAEALRAFMARFRLKTRADGLAFLSKLYFKRPIFAPLIGGDVLELFQRPFILHLMESFRADHQMSPESLAKLRMPILFSWGKGESLMLPEHLAYFKKHLPKHAIIEEPPHHGHCPHLEYPFEVAKRVLQFVRDLDTREAALERSAG